MKRLSIALLFFFGFIAAGFAQDSTTTHTKKVRSTSTQSSTGLKKDGSPDMRLKANKQAKAQAQSSTTTQATTTQTQAAPAPTTSPAPAQTQVRTRATTQTSKASSTKSADAAVGTDAKGRTIYQGSRGGKYTLTANGNKEYIKQ